jgi:hypothetical protein
MGVNGVAEELGAHDSAHHPALLLWEWRLCQKISEIKNFRNNYQNFRN